MSDNLLLWERYKKQLCVCPSIGLSLDFSRMKYPDGFLAAMEPAMHCKAFDAMDQLEKRRHRQARMKKRMVGHYWLRRSVARPRRRKIRQEIDGTLQRIHQFTADVHGGKIKTPAGKAFTDLLIVGIGGSAARDRSLSSDALTSPADKLRPHFLTTRDPDGMDRTPGHRQSPGPNPHRRDR